MAVVAIEQVLRLREGEPLLLERSGLGEEDAAHLHQQYEGMIDIDYPTPRTRGRWRLVSRGYVGSVPLPSGLRLVIDPKVSVSSIFRMLERAYDLRSITFMRGRSRSGRIEEVYSHLAHLLAQRVLDRARRGLHRVYITQRERLGVVRGRIDLADALRRPWQPELLCEYHSHTADIADNGILLWTLHTIVRQRICRGEVEARVREAVRALRGTVTLKSYSAADTVGRSYDRLNEDYRPLHALCRFFLENVGPIHETGEHAFLPFLVDMARLYESYVASWLRAHLDAGFRLDAQQSYALGPGGTPRITIDLVLRDRRTGETVAVLDTKYKTDASPSASDLQQIVAYAVARDCRRAVLIYPRPLSTPFNSRYGRSRVEVSTTHVSPDGEIGEVLAEWLGG